MTPTFEKHSRPTWGCVCPPPIHLRAFCLMLAKRIVVTMPACGLLTLAACPRDDPTQPGADATDTMNTDTGSGTGGCDLDMFEPNDSRMTATAINPDTTLTANLCKSIDDVDWWTFTLSDTSSS